MVRVPMVEPNAEPAELHEVFEQLRRTRGRVPAMYRTLAHQPAILTAHRAYFHATLDAGMLKRDFKEKIAYKVARMRGAAYSAGSHRSYALRHGVSSQELAQIDSSDYGAFLPNEMAALTFVEAMVNGGGKVPDALFDALRRHYVWAEIIEIVTLVGVMDLASTLGAVFELTPD